MTEPHLRVVGRVPARAGTATFFLIVADHDRGFFCVEGPMSGPGRMPRARLATSSAGASCAVQPARIETHSPAFRRGAS